MSEFDIISDNSQQNLKELPVKILQMCNLKMLYLEQNFLKELPRDFFLKLPRLCWLDLRNNHLEVIPESIGHHQYLENLLISDNKIEVLPNELGTVSKLKVLQVANNPIIYPDSKIIAEGTKAICAFLKRQYEKIHRPQSEDDEAETPETRDERELREEKEVRVMVEDYGTAVPAVQSISSSLIVKSLSRDNNQEKIVHKLTTDPPSQRILLKSYYEDDKYVKASTQTSANTIFSRETLRESWMDKLKLLLEEQEKILQQERLEFLLKLLHTLKFGVRRNLQALNTWRQQKKIEPIRTVTEELVPPYGTYPEFDSILSRNELAKQIDKMLGKKNPSKTRNIQKLINDLVSQLKDMEEISYSGDKTPRSEIEAAETQIRKIMEVHKQILKLQETNTIT